MRGDHVELPDGIARELIIQVFANLGPWALPSVEAFRNALTADSKAALAVAPMLDIPSSQDAMFLMGRIQAAVREGRLIDFGFLPNEVLRETSTRNRDLFEVDALPHPYPDWIGVHRWEGGLNGYFVTPHPVYPDMILIVELYGVRIPDQPGLRSTDLVLIYDLVSIRRRGPGLTDVIPMPFREGVACNAEQLKARGANSLDPLVTMLGLLSDASVPVVDVPAPEALNRKRRAQGRPPIPAYARVDTAGYVTAFRAGSAPTGRAGARGGTHASPHAHSRRAHLRHLKSGKIVPVRSTKVNWRDAEELHRLFYRRKS